MENTCITEIIEKAHTIALLELAHHLDNCCIENPDIHSACKKYRESFLEEISYASENIKEYDGNKIRLLTSMTIKEIDSDNIQMRVHDAIMKYIQKMIHIKITYSTAMALLSSRFTQETLDRYDVYPFSKDEILITRIKGGESDSITMDINTLISNIYKIESPEDILTLKT